MSATAAAAGSSSSKRFETTREAAKGTAAVAAWEETAAAPVSATGSAAEHSTSGNTFSGSSKKHKHQVNSFVHPPERHISVDPHELKMAVKNRLELSDRIMFDDLTKLMEGVANFDFFDLKARMRTNFLPFSCGARNDIYLQRSSKALPTTDTLNQKEEEFIADVYEVLAASHYTLLTKEEWDLATSENFNLNLPMEVNWDYMDKNLLAKFWQSSPQRKAMRQTLPDCMADRILVFHRGIGTERITGMLIDSKLDLLMDYTVFYLLDMIKAPFSKDKKDQGAAADKGAAASKTTQQAAAAAAGSSQTRAAGSGMVPAPKLHVPEDAAVEQYEYEGDAMIGSRHRFAKKVERQTLARQCPTLLTLLKSFPISLTLQEPTFKDLVVVYRRALPERKPPSASANAPNKNKEERLQGILQHRNINIKVFGETPMADVEIIFPDKVVGIKPFQLVNLAVTVITALTAGALVLWKATNINMNILWTAASLVLTRCFAVYTQAQTQRTMMQQQMTSSLYDKMQDSQEGVISVITEELSDQQLKQMLLAYMMLIMKGRAMLEDDLDTACEDFLMKEFEHPIDYDLDAALPRLKTWGLVKENNQGKLEALPMPEAINVLEQAWSIAYKEVGKTGDDKVPTIDMITGAFSVFGAGIEKHQTARRQAAEAAAAEAAKKPSLMGKAKGVFGTSNKSSGGGAGLPPVAPNGVAGSTSATTVSAAAVPTTPTPDPAYGGGAYAAGAASPPSAADYGAADDSDKASQQGSSQGGSSVERKKSSSMKGLFKKLKA